MSTALPHRPPAPPPEPTGPEPTGPEPTGPEATGADPTGLPRRDDQARAHLDLVGSRSGPVVRAHERGFLVPGELGALLGGLRRGSVVVVEGRPGTGATSVAFALAAAVTGVGEWAAALVAPGRDGGDGTLGPLAAAEAGVALARFAVVRRVSTARWATAVSILLDAAALVVAEVPVRVGLGDARRLVARARERGTVLVPFVSGTDRAWPADAAVRIRTAGGPWSGLGTGSGLLDARTLTVEVETHGATRRRCLAARAG